MTENRQSGPDVVKRAVQPVLEALFQERCCEGDLTPSMARFRAALALALEAPPTETDVVSVMISRAVIAAGFEAALREIEEKVMGPL
jgi:hypothetical protein